MVMENPFEGKEIWFGVGSQDLYGEEALRQVAIHSAEMVDYLNNTGKIPAKIVLKPTLKSSDGVKEFMVEASANPNVIGVITWCHTFSPAKMWIRGLEVLTKPLLQLATQQHKEIPWETIDMDFMNLNQAAHGDREFGYIVSRLGIKRKVVVGHYTDPEVAEKLALRLKFDAENGKGSYLKARSSEICEMLVKRFGLDLSKKKKRASVKKSDDAEDEE